MSEHRLALTTVPFDHPDAVRLIGELQAVYRQLYGGEDTTPLDPTEFAAPGGFFAVGYHGALAVACGGWRARDATATDPALRDGDAEIKRMYVAPGYRGRGYARALLAELERSAAAAGRRRLVLETGIRQPEAIALYTAAGYQAMPKFGSYRAESGSRCLARRITNSDRRWRDASGERMIPVTCPDPI